MFKKKECVKVVCTCIQSDMYAYAICEEKDVPYFKQRLLRSIVDFVNINSNEFEIDFNVEKTTEQPEVGTDLFIKPLVEKKHVVKKEIDVIDLK